MSRTHENALSKLKYLAETELSVREKALKNLAEDTDAMIAIADPGSYAGKIGQALFLLKPREKSMIERAAKELLKTARLELKVAEPTANRPPGQNDDGTGPEEDVWFMLDLNKKGTEPIPSMKNLVTILECDTRWSGRFRRNVFSYAEELDGRLGRDNDVVHLMVWLDANYSGVQFTTAQCLMAMQDACWKNEYHPVREYLDGLVWDGVPRIDFWLTKHCQCPADEITRKYARRFLLSSIARVVDPGSKVDTALIMQGGQGLKKTSALEALAGTEFFSNSVIQIGSKEAYQSIMGVWIYELGELDSIRRREKETTKGFMSARKDKFRPPYGRHDIQVARQVVFAGSTNEEDFLTDETGSRRFWCVTPGYIDVPGIIADRDQLWAEALHEYCAGSTAGSGDAPSCPVCAAAGLRCGEHRWWFERDEDVERAISNERYQAEDPWLSRIDQFCRDRKASTKGYHTADILQKALGIKPGDITRVHEMRLRVLMLACGWQRPTQKFTVDGVRARGYYPPTTS